MEHEAGPWLLFAMSCMVMVALALFAILATRRLDRIPTRRIQNFVEMVVQALNDFVVDVIGPEGKRYTPFIGSLFIFILSANLLGLIPGLKSPTSSLSVTISLALIVFVAYNVIGIRRAGIRRYVKHLVGEPVWLAPLMLPVHIIGELARPLSLSVRLFGNMFGEEMILAILAGLTVVIVPYLIAIPTQFPIMLFDIFISFVQALVFTMLSAIYISLALEAAEEH